MIFIPKWLLIGSIAFVSAISFAQTNAAREGQKLNSNENQNSLLGTKAGYVGELSDGKRHGKGLQRLANGDSYDGEWVNGKRHGFGVYRWATGVVAEGDWFEDNRNGFSLRTGQDGVTYAEHYVKGVKALTSSDLGALLDHGRGCNGQFEDWVLLKGKCTKEGFVKDQSGNFPELVHREKLDQFRIVAKQGVLTLFRQGVVIEGPLRGPFNFISATIKKPVLGTDGKSISWVNEYSGPMRGMAMHGRGKCALPAGQMEDCTMNEGQRVTGSKVASANQNATDEQTVASDSEEQVNILASAGASLPQSSITQVGNKNPKNFSDLLSLCDKKDAKSCVAAAQKIIGNEAFSEITDKDARQRLAVDVLDKAIAIGSVDALNMEFDIFDASKMPSPIALMSLTRKPGIVAELEKIEEDSARIRVAYERLTTLNPLMLVFGSLDGSLTAHCNQIRLIKAKGVSAMPDSSYVESILNTPFCK